MRTPIDALRSVSKYVAAVLGEDWEVRWATPPGTYKTPFARVQLVGSPATSGSAYFYEITQPMSIECYPKPIDDEEESMMAALQVQQDLIRGFRGAGVEKGRPLRVPLFDYDGVAINEGSDSRHPSDYLRILDFAARALPHPEDPQRVAVVCDLRASWRVDIDLTELRDRSDKPVRGQKTVVSVDTTFE